MKILLELFVSFFKIGAFTLGGGFAMIPIIQKEIVEDKKWIKEDEFLDMVALSQSAPGPIAVNISAFVGKKVQGVKGLIVASLGAILPSFIIIILVMDNRIKNNETVTTSSNNKQKYKILVDVEDSKLYLFENNELKKEYKCSGGKWSTPSPIGTWTIVSKAKWGEGFGRKLARA